PAAGPAQFFVCKMRREKPSGRVEDGEGKADLIKPPLEEVWEKRGGPIGGGFCGEGPPRRTRGSPPPAVFRGPTKTRPQHAAAPCASLEPFGNLCPSSLFQVVEDSRQKFDGVSIRVNDRMIEPGAYGRGLRRGCSCHNFPPLLLLRLLYSPWLSFARKMWRARSRRRKMCCASPGSA